MLVAVGAELDGTLQTALRRGAGPQRADALQGVDAEALARSDRHGAADGLDVEDEARLAVIGRDAESQAAALADGERVGAVVLAQHLAVLVDDRARTRPELVAQPAGVVTVGDEADVVA